MRWNFAASDLTKEARFIEKLEDSNRFKARAHLGSLLHRKATQKNKVFPSLQPVKQTLMTQTKKNEAHINLRTSIFKVQRKRYAREDQAFNNHQSKN